MGAQGRMARCPLQLFLSCWLSAPCAIVLAPTRFTCCYISVTITCITWAVDPLDLLLVIVLIQSEKSALALFLPVCPLCPFFCWKLRILLSSVNDTLLPSFSARPLSDCLPRLLPGLSKWLSFTWCSTNSKQNVKLHFQTLHRHGTPCGDLITVRTAISKPHLEYESILFLYVLNQNL